MKQAIVHVALVVRDYDEAIRFFTGILDFDLIEDSFVPDQNKRWVVVAPPGARGTSLLLARPSNASQEAFVGNQTGGRVTFFLGTDDFWRDYSRLVGRGVEFVRPPLETHYGTVAVFRDLYGNLWDLVEYVPGHPARMRMFPLVTAGTVLQTERLALREFTVDDDAFILDLLNQPSFLHYIGDRNVRTLADARNYIEQGPLASYREPGYGLYVVTLSGEHTRIGMCGIVHKPWLAAPDIAYAFLPQFEGKGYASEAARAVLEHARSEFGVDAVLGVVTPDNQGSMRVLQKLGFKRESTVVDPRTDTELVLFAQRT